MKKTDWIIIGIILCCVYIISPVDLVSEIALGPFGVIDDAGVLGFMLFLIKQLWTLRSGAQSEKREIKRAVVDADDIQKSVDPPKIPDET